MAVLGPCALPFAGWDTCVWDWGISNNCLTPETAQGEKTREQAGKKKMGGEKDGRIERWEEQKTEKRRNGKKTGTSRCRCSDPTTWTLRHPCSCIRGFGIGACGWPAGGLGSQRLRGRLKPYRSFRRSWKWRRTARWAPSRTLAFSFFACCEHPAAILLYSYKLETEFSFALSYH